jgi:hypothetical protein
MNALSIAPLSRKTPRGFCPRAILGLSLIGAFLLVGADSVEPTVLEVASTEVGFVSPVMPVFPFVTVFLLNIQP